MFLRTQLLLFITCFFSLSAAAQLSDTHLASTEFPSTQLPEIQVNPKAFSFNPSQSFNSDFYVQSNLEFTLLHELAHAVIELHDIPVLGGQEQAADQIALMLSLIHI